MLSFGALSDMIENGKRLDFNSAFFFIFSQDDVQEFVIELNTDGQLFTQGIDSTGRDLSSIGGDYSPFTVQQKKFDSLPFDRVTLFQEGDFYNTWSVKALKDSIVISADTIKEGEDLQDRWGDEIIGLTDESIEELNKTIIPIIIEYLIKELLQ